MNAPFIEVKLPCNESVTLEYSPKRLLTASIEVAEAAIAQQEAAHMTRFFGFTVLEDIYSLLLVNGLYPVTLIDHFQHRQGGSVECTYVAEGRAYWKFELRCEECCGTGTTYTRSNKRVPCPDCAEGGTTSAAYFFTNLNGRFVGWDAHGAAHPFLDPVVNYGHGSEAIRLTAMPEDKALEAVAGWWS